MSTSKTDYEQRIAELKATGIIVESLQEFNPDAARRILNWVRHAIPRDPSMPENPNPWLSSRFYK